MFVSKEEYHRRYEICKSCDSFNSVIKLCKECGCFMQLKCKISAVFCPKKHWERGESTATVEPETIDGEVNRGYRSAM